MLAENGNNEVQSTTSGLEADTSSTPEATVIAQRCSAKCVIIYKLMFLLIFFSILSYMYQNYITSISHYFVK